MAAQRVPVAFQEEVPKGEGLVPAAHLIVIVVVVVVVVLCVRNH
jgi:hypothetical protein